MTDSPRQRTNPMLVQWVLHGLALLVLGLVMGGNLYHERVKVETREQERLLSQTQIVQRILDANLVSLNDVLGALSRDWGAGGGDRDISHRLITLVDALTGVRTLLILDSQGVARAANRPELLGRDFSQREYFQAARQRPDPDMLFVSPPFRTSLGVYAITVTRLIQGPDNAFAGIVTATLDPEFFIPLLKSVLYAPDMRATLAHSDGLLFLMVPEREGIAGTNLDQPGSFFRRHRDSGREASVLGGRSAATGAERLLAARTIRPAGLRTDKTLEVTIGRDPQGIYENWRKEALFQGVLFGLAVLASSLGLFILQRRQRVYDREMAEAAQALAASERFVKTTADSLPGMVSYWGEDLKCVYSNHAYLEWFGKTPEQMQGISIQELMGEELFRKNEPFIRAALRGEPQRFEHTLVKADGSTGYTLARYIPDVREGRVWGFFVLISDVTELKATQMELERRVQELDILATTDSLTNMANRRHFSARAKEEFDRSSRYGLPLVCLMLDIDHFKATNDTFGHDAGDEVLKALAVHFRDTLRSTDVLGRLGGEEFGALLIQTEIEGARQISERLRQVLQEAVVETRSGPIRFTVSIGLAASTGGDACVEDLMKRADLALYKAKEMGRNRVCCFEDS